MRIPVMRLTMLRLILVLFAALSALDAQAAQLRFLCRGWAPLYLSSWRPENPDPTDFDMMTIDADDETGITRFDLPLVGRLQFKASVTDYAVKATIPYKQMMMDDYIDIIDFYYNRPSSEILITALEKKTRKGHPLFKGKCAKVRPNNFEPIPPTPIQIK